MTISIHYRIPLMNNFCSGTLLDWQRTSQLCTPLHKGSDLAPLPKEASTSFLPQVLLLDEFCVLLTRSQCLPFEETDPYFSLDFSVFFLEKPSCKKSAIIPYDKRPNLSPRDSWHQMTARRGKHQCLAQAARLS